MIRLRLSSPFFRAALVGSLLPCLLATAQAQRTVRTTTETTISRYESRAAGAEDSIHRGDADMNPRGLRARGRGIPQRRGRSARRPGDG